MLDSLATEAATEASHSDTRQAWRRVKLFGIEIDAVTPREACEIVRGWAAEPLGECRYVVTPNVDHIVMLRDDIEFQSAYRDADLVLADGWPVVSASRMLGQPLPERVPGSDLVPHVLQAATAQWPLSAFLLGAAPGVGDRAAANIHRACPHVTVAGVYSPPLGFERDESECERIVNLIGQARPDLLIVGLGAPKQELWVHRHRPRVQAKVALCVGATIDFLAGEKPRAPRWLQRLRLEWLHRMLGDPRRLTKRYARDAWIFPRMIWQAWHERARPGLWASRLER